MGFTRNIVLIGSLESISLDRALYEGAVLSELAISRKIIWY
jgi:hypothetical protein